jgi:hypothetical protein
MICALLDFEKVIFENAELPHFRCKMPNLPTDVPHQMAFELLQVFVKEEGVYKTPFAGTSLYFLDNAENYHNNSVTTGIYLTHLDCDYDTTKDGNSFYMNLNTKPFKIYISTKQNYLYFKIQDKLNQLSNMVPFQAEERKLIKVDSNGNHSTFGVTSDAPYDKDTNMWNINGTNNVSFNNEPLISGGAFTIMFSYKTPSDGSTLEWEEFVCFSNTPNEPQPNNQLPQYNMRIRRYVNSGHIQVKIGGLVRHYNSFISSIPNITNHFTFVIIPNVDVKFYNNGIQYNPNYKYDTLGDLPAQIYTYQNIGGLNYLLRGSMGNFRFYDRELSDAEILAIGSIGATSNDLVPFNPLGYNSVTPIGTRQVNNAKMVVRLTFDKKQNEYQPKRIML